MRKWGIALIALILVGAVACTSSGSGGKTSAPTSALPTTSTATTTPSAPSTSPSPTPTVATTGPNVRPGEKPPTYPAASLKNSRSGALSFATFWFEAWDWAYATMDPTLLALQSAPSCSDCLLVVEGFREAAAAGQHFVGGRLALQMTEFATNDGRNGADQAVDVTFGQPELRIVNSEGRTVRTDAGVPRVTFRFWLKWTGKRWVTVQKGHVTR